MIEKSSILKVLDRIREVIFLALLREAILPKYRIIYFVSDEGDVEIITIRLTSKPLPPGFKPST